jgi:hypothetical protein
MKTNTHSFISGSTPILRSTAVLFLLAILMQVPIARLLQVSMLQITHYLFLLTQPPLHHVTLQQLSPITGIPATSFLTKGSPAQVLLQQNSLPRVLLPQVSLKLVPLWQTNIPQVPYVSFPNRRFLIPQVPLHWFPCHKLFYHGFPKHGFPKCWFLC